MASTRTETSEGEGWLTIAVAMASVLVPLNSTMLVVALPHLLKDLHAGLAAGGWLVTIYLITMASLQPVTGKVGDRLGPRRVLLFGLTAFALGSIGCALAPNIATLIVARALQGVAGAMTMPNAMAMLRRLIPAHRLGAKMGTVGAAITAGAAVGPVIGGLLVEVGDWRSVFWVNVPLVAIILAVAIKGIPDIAPAPAVGRFDLPGSLGLLVLLGGGAVLLTRARGIGIGIGAAAFLALLMVGYVFLRHERAHGDPVVQPRLFARLGYTAGVGGIALGNLAMYVTLLAVPVLLGRREHWSGGAVGGTLSSLSFASLVMSPIGGRLADRLGPRRPATIGMAFGVAGLVALAVGARGLGLVAALTMSGVGFGLAFSSFQLAALASAEVSIAGAASGVMSTCRYVGSIVGTSLLAGPLAPDPKSTNFRPVFAMTAIAAIGAGVLATLLPKILHAEEGDSPEITATVEDGAAVSP